MPSNLQVIGHVSRILLDSGLKNTHRLFNTWSQDRQLNYIEHMKQLGAKDPEKFHLFSDIFAELVARQIGD